MVNRVFWLKGSSEMTKFAKRNTSLSGISRKLATFPHHSRVFYPGSSSNAHWDINLYTAGLSPRALSAVMLALLLLFWITGRGHSTFLVAAWRVQLRSCMHEAGVLKRAFVSALWGDENVAFCECSVSIHKFYRVVDCEMLVAKCCDVIVGLPLVAINNGVTSGSRQQCFRIHKWLHTYD